MTDFTFYILVIIAFVIGVYLIKKFVGCMIRSIITIIIIAILTALYFMYFK